MTALPAPAELVARISSALGPVSHPVVLHEPLFIGNEAAYTQSCIEEGWVSSVGKFVDRFEIDLAAAAGARFAVAVVNGTCALHMALIASGIKPGQEVLIPSLTFVATANSVSHAGGTPHFVEVEEESLGIDPEKLRSHLSRIAKIENGACVNKETGRVIHALAPVHVFGHPCRLSELRALAEEFGLALIEDATEALGSQIGGKPVGSGGLAVFSFNGNKIITCGGGGAIVTDDEALHKRMKHLTTTAKQPHAWRFDHDDIAWNYRLPNLNAALACAQLEQLPLYLKAKRALAERYLSAFKNLPGARILREPAGTASNYWLVTLLADQADESWLNDSLQALHGARLLCRPVWTPLHLSPMYRENPRDGLSLTEALANRIINLPSSPKLGMPYVSQ